jgi:hypothetical protein
VQEPAAVAEAACPSLREQATDPDAHRDGAHIELARATAATWVCCGVPVRVIRADVLRFSFFRRRSFRGTGVALTALFLNKLYPRHCDTKGCEIHSDQCDLSPVQTDKRLRRRVGWLGVALVLLRGVCRAASLYAPLTTTHKCVAPASVLLAL